MKTKLILIALLFSIKLTWAQTTIFSENMGTPSGITAITANSFQNGSFTYSNGAQASPADVRPTSASSSYSGASGGGNVYFTTTSGAYGFSIEGINASQYNTLNLQFGYMKIAAASHATFSVDYWNGTVWTTLANSSSTLFNEAAGAPAVWYLSKVLSLPTDAQINGLKIRFVKTGTAAIRIDDVKLTGIQTAPTVLTTTVASVTTNSATFAGNVTDTGGASITANGTVYARTSVNPNPVVGGSGVVNLATTSPNSGTGSFSKTSGTILLTNVQYSYKAYATKSTGLRGYGTLNTFYTLAATPYAPIVTNPTGNSLSISIDIDDNPSTTTYCISETTTSKYVQLDGTLGTVAVYQTPATWGTKVVSGLLPSTTYSFEIKAQNGDGILTASSDATMETTLEQATIATSGTLVALNTIYGTYSNFTSFTLSATNLTDNLIITAPNGYEISKTIGGTTAYGTTQTLIPTSGTISSTTIYVRLAATTPFGSYDGNITLISANDGLTENVATTLSSVARKAVTISGITAANKVYDGNALTHMVGVAVLNGILAADAADIFLDESAVIAQFSDAAMGTGKPVTVTGYGLYGEMADSYEVVQPTGFTADITGSTNSDIILNTSSTTSSNQNMNYMAYQGTTLTSTTNSNGVMGLRLRDGGASANDSDNLPTELTAITFTVTNAANLRSARLFASNSAKGIAIAVPTPDSNGVSTLTFTGLTDIVALDGEDLAINLRVTFNSQVTDNQQMQFKVVSVTAKSNGSLFASTNGGGAISPTTANINRILVVADRLAFTVQPNDTYETYFMSPPPAVKTIDAFGNTDLDYSGYVTITSSGSLSPMVQTASVTNGIATFWGIVHSASGTGFVLHASTPSFAAVNSTTFDIDSSSSNPNQNPNEDPNTGISSTTFYHDTQGKLEISNSGQPVYTLPIALPPSIASVGPTINLMYAGGQDGGIAGQGWNINSISHISRIATRKDIDGFVDGVDFDANDKLALDGQRLLVKSGSTYWADGSLYETEMQSNNKIQLMGTGSNVYFIVTATDGSRYWYGNYGGVNATDFSAYYLVRFEDVNGNFVLYNYNRPLNKNLCIDTIQFSANTISNPTPLNYIKFNYTTAARTERAFFKGQLIEKSELLNKIKVYTNGNLFKEYRLTHTKDSQLGYQRLTRIQEFNGAGESANPVIFKYNSTENTVNETTTSYTDSYPATDNPQQTGDFDGDGKLDIISNNKMYLKTFSNNVAAPLDLPQMSHRRIVASTIKDSKLKQSQTLVALTLAANSMEFKYFGYDQGSSSIILENTKTITGGGIDNTAACLVNCVGAANSSTNFCGDVKLKNTITYLEGDFNGDGISEAIVATYDETDEYGMDPSLCATPDPELGGEEICFCSHLHRTVGTTPTQVLLVNLDNNASTTVGSPGVVALSGLGITRYYLDKTLIGDYNGDGKTDIMVIKYNKSYKVYSFNQLLVAPWVEVEVIGEGILDSYAVTKQIQSGDYNGDGKTDIMIPEGDGECIPRSAIIVDGQVIVPAVVCPNIDIWDIFYSNPNPAGGTFFTKRPTTITNYIRQHGDDYNHYYPLDINKDGKTDLVKTSVALYWPGGFFDPTNVDSRWQVSTYVNNIGNNIGGATDFIFTYESGNHKSNDNSVPIPLIADIKHNGLSSDMIVIRYHNHNSFAKKITYIDFTKDVFFENLLQKVTQSNGGIVDEISYSSMESSEDNGGFGSASDFYSSNNSVNYPLVELKQIARNKLVSLTKNTALGFTRRMDFRYNGYVVQLDGVGSIGFKKVARTAWYNSTSGKKIWAVTELDPLQRGTTKLQYTLEPSTANFSFPSNLTTGLINKTENNFTTSAPNVFPYVVLLQNQKTTDYKSTVVKEILYNNYDPVYYLPTNVTNNNYKGTILQGSTNTVTVYDPPSFGSGSSYYIGRPHSTTTTATIYGNTIPASGNTKKSSQTMSYVNGNISQIDKNVYQPDGVTLDPVTMVEKMNYYPNGLLMDSEVSATGTTAGVNDVAPRKTSYTYDATNRFISTTTNPELLVSTNMSFHPLYGTVLMAKDPFNQTTTIVYDNWGKLISTTDNTLNIKKNYAYSRANNKYTTTETKSTASGIFDGSSSITDIDVLGREIRRGSKSLDGTWVYTATEYDSYGRKYRTSEPYFGGGSASQWNEFAYDDYSRPIKTTSFTQKEVNTSYLGLKVTVADSVMSKSKTEDANGLTIITTDSPGGTINHKYDANGNLLESDYDGIKTTFAYDNWGRKIDLTDSSTGTYNTYSYNAYGEILSEATQKGITQYIYDGLSGRVLTKKTYALLPGNAPDTSNSLLNTKIEITYNFNATTKLLDSMTVINPNDGDSSFAYTYDVERRLYKTEETQTLLSSGTAVFTKQLTFDNFSRIETDTNTATAFGKTSTKAIKHVYSANNGEEYQIKDNSNFANLWQVNTVDPKGNILTASLGNGINIANTYDQFGYAAEFKHKLGAVDVMKLNTTFDPILGNLTSRYNSMFDIQQDYTYDALDRLTEWDGGNVNLMTLPFNTTTDGFTFSGTSTQGSVYNSVGKLRVTLKNDVVYAGKDLNITAVPGDKFHLRGDISNKTSFHSITKLLLIETDVNDNYNYIETQIVTIANGTFDLDYITSDNFENAKLSLKFIIEEVPNSGGGQEYWIDDNPDGSTPVTAAVTFFLDNLKIDKLEINRQDYDDRGRITNNNVGQYSYDSSHPYQNSTIQMTPYAITYYNGRPQQDVEYNAFKAPVKIEEQDIDLIKFGYNAFEERSAMYYGNTSEDKLSKPYRKYYSADGNMEIKATFAPGNTTTPVAVEFMTYMDGDAYSASVVLKSDGTTPNYYYLHRDYQGSILAITNSTGTVVEKRLFDPWGEIIKVEDGTGNPLTQLTFFDRGYTGHEHLQSVGLINMNARLYDPKLHRFLSADNYVQDPYNTQNYNRYGYCVNNPLKYTDITGNKFTIATVAAAVFPLFGNMISSLLLHQPYGISNFAWDVAYNGFVIGVTYGIGDACSTITNLYLNATVSAVAHGTFQGGMASLMGGKFWSTFTSTALSSFAMTMWQGNLRTEEGFFKENDWAYGTRQVGHAGWGAGTGQIGSMAFSAIVGGATSSLTGGNFWEGVSTAVVVGAFNHLMHQGGPPKYEYNGIIYDNKVSLYGAILLDQAAEQFGIKDIVALGAGLSGYNIIPTRGKFGGAIKGTSLNSKLSRNITKSVESATFGMIKKLPTLTGGPFTGAPLRKMMVNTIGRFLGRTLGPIGWAMLAYDVGMTLYNTQVIYNRITNGK